MSTTSAQAHLGWTALIFARRESNSLQETEHLTALTLLTGTLEGWKGNFGDPADVDIISRAFAEYVFDL